MDKNNLENEKQSSCDCGKVCHCCKAEKLTVTAGSDLEAKQFEYNLDKKLSHHSHDSGSQAFSDDKIIYTCSMHPNVRRKHPGKCPGCGMELIPIPAKAATGKIEKKEAVHEHHD